MKFFGNFCSVHCTDSFGRIFTRHCKRNCFFFCLVICAFSHTLFWSWRSIKTAIKTHHILQGMAISLEKCKCLETIIYTSKQEITTWQVDIHCKFWQRWLEAVRIQSGIVGPVLKWEQIDPMKTWELTNIDLLYNRVAATLTGEWHMTLTSHCEVIFFG